MNDLYKVTVEENYREFTPPVPVRKVVEELLAYVPEKYLAGLTLVELTNVAGLNHHQRRIKVWRRNRKFAVRKAEGLYHGSPHGRIGWIQLFIDNIFEGDFHWLLWLPFVRKLLISSVLYHEIGHHIQETQSFEHRERENVADRWQGKLSGYYFKRRYWYLYPLMYIMAVFYRKVGKRFLHRY